MATTGEGVGDIVDGTVAHKAWLESSPVGHSKRLTIVSQTIATLVGDRVTRAALKDGEESLRELASQCVSRKLTPLEAVERFLKSRRGKIKF